VLRVPGVFRGRRAGCLLLMAVGVFAPLSAAVKASPSRLARGPWCGAVTPTSAEVRAKIDQSGRVVRVWVSRAPDFSQPIILGPVTSRREVAGNVVGFHLTHLRPNITYYYAFEVKGELELEKAGHFRTSPTGSASFEFAFASCGRTGSTNASYERIREHQPLFFLCPGDFHYEDVRSNRVESFYSAYDKVFASKVQARLYREVPLVYLWDDHDFCGNNSDDRAVARPAVRQAYQDYFPHYPFWDTRPEGVIAQTFVVGRVKFIMTDLRSHRDPAAATDGPGKSMMGPVQREWWKRELLAANGVYPLIFWVSSVPWIGSMQTNHYWPVTTNEFGYRHHLQLDYTTTKARPAKPVAVDSWAAYAHERAELAQFIKSRQIRGLVILQGDMHALAADDGSNSDYAPGGGAPIPVMAAAPLDQDASLKGGPYSQGLYKPRKREGCFGLVTVHDEGGRITAHFSGRNNADEEQVTLTVVRDLP